MAIKVKPVRMWALVAKDSGEVCWNYVRSQRKDVLQEIRFDHHNSDGKADGWRKRWAIVPVIVRAEKGQ